MNRNRRRAVVASLLVGMVALAGCGGASIGGTLEGPPTVVAHGMGRVTGIPDTVVITLGVETEGTEASDALSRNNTRTASVIELFKQAGVPEDDIQTSQFSIFPRHDFEARTINGYTVTNLLTVRVGEPLDAGELIDAAAGAAGNDIRVQSVHFEIDDKGDLYAQARADAVERAREQAEQLADAAGVSLGRVRSITEMSTGFSPPIPFALPRTDAFAEDSFVPIQPGTEEITLEVEVIYEIS